jgi:predicted nucleic acid-binding protein
VVVSDTSPILNLACIGRLDLLHALYRQIVIPPAVFHELALADPDAPGAAQVRSADWIAQHPIANKPLVRALRLELDAGEAEAIACALELKATLLLMDERRGREIAQRMGLPVLGLLGVLLLAQRRGLVPALRPLLDDLRNKAGFWISDALYRRVLLETGEPMP